ncbi:MAG TPA: hypothetical protein VFU94_11795 [Conexibacter sp.]|nr:hypothetical protein [Conexibacter sp.]
MRRSSRCLSPVVLATLVLSACGGGNVGSGTTAPTASAPDAKAPPADATQPGTGPVTTVMTQTAAPKTAPTPTRTQAPAPSAAGGAQPVRVPAAFVVMPGGRLTPATITVPPFLAVEVSLRSSDGKPHELTLRAPAPAALRVGAGGRASVRIPGLRAGRYAVLLDGRRAGALVVGGDGGP